MMSPSADGAAVRGRGGACARRVATAAPAGRKPLPSPLQRIESKLTFFTVESDVKLIRNRQDLHVFQIFTYIVHFEYEKLKRSVAELVY